MADATDGGPKGGGASSTPLPIGPIDLPHRDGTRVIVGTPIHVGGERPWMCAAKLVGKKKPDGDDEMTQTLLLRTGRGSSPEDAQKAALSELKHFYGSPNEPIPEPLILHKPSEPPPPPRKEGKRGLLGWLATLFSKA
jgi:hypothetical protein